MYIPHEQHNEKFFFSAGCVWYSVAVPRNYIELFWFLVGFFCQLLLKDMMSFHERNSIVPLCHYRSTIDKHFITEMICSF